MFRNPSMLASRFRDGITLRPVDHLPGYYLTSQSKHSTTTLDCPPCSSRLIRIVGFTKELLHHRPGFNPAKEYYFMSVVQAVSVTTFDASIGVNVHLSDNAGPYGNLPMVETELGFLGIHQVRDN